MRYYANGIGYQSLICSYLRSSSINTLDWCEQKYFLSYVLGIKEVSNIAAEKGTIVHKVMELCAQAKKAKQEGHTSFVDDEFGKISCKECNDVGKLAIKVYKQLSAKLTHFDWEDKDAVDCIKHCYNIIEFNDGAFDPRKRNVIDCEKFFDLPLENPWAKYNFSQYNLSGTLAIKGTIDLVTEVDSETLEAIDWKTGRTRNDWVTGKEKNYDDFYNDNQLRLYYYALSLLYPQYENILITIFFSVAGGPFTIIFSKDDLAITEKMFQDKFERVKRIKKPHLTVNYKCSRFCHYGKNKFEGSCETICSEINNHTNKFGINSTMEKYGDLSKIENYTGGGRTKEA